MRCWRCCIKAEYPTSDGWLIFINRELAGPQFIRLFNDLVICELLTANDNLQTTCLIYENRPRKCRENLCLKEKQNVHAVTGFGRWFRRVLADIASAISSVQVAANPTTAT